MTKITYALLNSAGQIATKAPRVKMPTEPVADGQAPYPFYWTSVADTVLAGVRASRKGDLPSFRVARVAVGSVFLDADFDNVVTVALIPLIAKVEEIFPDRVVFPQAVSELRGSGRSSEAAEILNVPSYPREALHDFALYPELNFLTGDLQQTPAFHIPKGAGYDTPELTSVQRDCNFLGRLLQEAVQELPEGERLLKLVRNPALVSKKSDESYGLNKRKDLSYMKQAHLNIKELSDEDHRWIAKIDTVWFLLQNLAEDMDRLHKVSDARLSQKADERKESVGAAIQRLFKCGFSAAQVRRILSLVHARIVATKHPTDVLSPERFKLLEEIAPYLPSETQENGSAQVAEKEVKLRIMSLLLGDEVRGSPPTPREEAKSGMGVLKNFAVRAISGLSRETKTAFSKYLGEPLGKLPKILSLGSWMASDREGHDGVTAEVTKETANDFRDGAFELYCASLIELFKMLPISLSVSETPVGLSNSIQADGQAPPPTDKNWVPYQIKIQQILKKLEQESQSTLPTPEYGAAQLEKDLELLEASLREKREHAMFADCDQLQNLLHHVRSCHYHIAAMDVRQACHVHERGVAQLLGFAGILNTNIYDSLDEKTKKQMLLEEMQRRNQTPFIRDEDAPGSYELVDLENQVLGVALEGEQRTKALEKALLGSLAIHAYQKLPEEERAALLEQRLASTEPFPTLDASSLMPEAQELLKVFGVIKKLVARDKDSVESYIISLTHGASNVLEILFLMKLTGLGRVKPDGEVESDLNVTPLLEIEKMLIPGKTTEFLTKLFSSPTFAKHIEAKDELFEIMIGPSDLGMQIGAAAARIYLWFAQWEIGNFFRTQKVNYNPDNKDAYIEQIAKSGPLRWRIYFGGGFPRARGGGRVRDFFAAIPVIARNGLRKFTQQGEAIRLNLGINAKRILEQTLYFLICQFLPPSEQPPELTEKEMALLREIAELSKEPYKELRDRSDFWPWVLQGTTMAWTKVMKHGSRKSTRGGSKQIEKDKVRAIPYVGAFIQTRYLMNSYYGLGSALTRLIQEGQLNELQSLYDKSEIARVVLETALLELARARLEISEMYGGKSHIHDLIANEFELAKLALQKFKLTQEFTKHFDLICREIDARNPYTDVLNYVQLETIKRLKKVDLETEKVKVAAFTYDDAAAKNRLVALEKRKSYLEETLAHTMHGIAYAMRTYG